MDQIKKTGATPMIVEGLGGGEILGIAESRTFLVRYRDGGTGAEEIAKVDVYGNGDVFIEDRHRMLGKAQGWFRDAILARVAAENFRTIDGAIAAWAKKKADEKREAEEQKQQNEAALATQGGEQS